MLEQFEKWWNEGCISGVNFSDDKKEKEGWKAALEWVLEDEECINVVAKQRIRKELYGKEV